MVGAETKIDGQSVLSNCVIGNKCKIGEVPPYSKCSQSLTLCAHLLAVTVKLSG